MEKYYKNHLAHIHDKYFGDLSKNAALDLITNIWTNQTGRNVIDIGCGSGILASILVANDFSVTGVDISNDILEIARKRAPSAKFIHASLHNFEFSPCDIVTAIGEPINYLFDHKSNYESCFIFFNKVYNNLEGNGLFVFDFLTTKIGLNDSSKIIEKEDMTMFLSVAIDKDNSILKRTMIYFIKDGNFYVRDTETHKQYLFDEKVIVDQLLSIGFEVKKIDGYNGHQFRDGHIGLICNKVK
ncbi:MAG: methyltransferase domain-containing protein [Cyclobacteriaceae bacterium]|nr:methyltransferase domain-containing protein [Cyclobacteriaceae bacterium]